MHEAVDHPHQKKSLHYLPVSGDPVARQRELDDGLGWVRIFPVVTLVLVAGNALVWLLTVALGATVMAATPEQLLGWGANAASEVQRGEYWRLLTAMFLHGGLGHVFMNMVSLVFFGLVAERLYGHRQFLLLYFGSGLVGSALSLHFSAQQGVSAGASGAVYGVLGAYATGMFLSRRFSTAAPDKQLPMRLVSVVVYSLMLGFAGTNVDNAAHVGGLVAGCLLALLMPVRMDVEHFSRLRPRRMAAGAALACVAVMALTISAPPAELDMRKLQQGQADFQSGLLGLQAAMNEAGVDEAARKAGKISDQQLEDKHRHVFLPRLKKARAELGNAWLPPHDIRQPLIPTSRRMAELLIEIVEMPTVQGSEYGKLAPSDPHRVVQIEAELKQLGEQMNSDVLEIQALQHRQKR